MKNLSLVVFLLASFSVFSAENDVQLENMWIRSGPPNAKVLAGYGEIRNSGSVAVTIASISSSDFEKIELHESMIHNGMVMMHEVEDKTIKAGSSITLESNSYHLMLKKPGKKLKAGDKVNLVFKFTNGSFVETRVEIKMQDQPATGHGHNHH
ncbi:MAG: copper chaperone PCu(A)C [Gammaproteobacteria bacterium]|nr:copper chaperone PCu(A)C [Gammaproteobacteria bacterium]